MAADRPKDLTRRPGRLRRAYRCELLKASRQPALAVYAFIILAATVFAAWQSAGDPEESEHSANGVSANDTGLFEAPPEPEAEPESRDRNAFLIFAAGAKTGFAVAAVLILLFSANLLAGEATGGTFRLLLVRPITKTDLILAKWVLVVTLVVTFSLIITFSAWLTGLLLGSYGDVTDYHTASMLTDRTLICAAVTPLGLLAVAGLGLFISSLFQSSAGSVTTATLVGISALALNLFLTEADSLYNLATYAYRYMSMLESWVGGESSYPFTLRQVRPALLVPPAYAFAFLLGARIMFGCRDIHS